METRRTNHGGRGCKPLRTSRLPAEWADHQQAIRAKRGNYRAVRVAVQAFDRRGLYRTERHPRGDLRGRATGVILQKFTKRLKEIEGRIPRKNSDKRWKNRVRIAFPRQCSTEGMTGKGIRNSGGTKETPSISSDVSNAI
ncbi:hypothetical protein MLD38_010523 [Melastoma candidum]|uniref:Uncharacterized protein n=1 Tax=Melastoma candidum TaxID=119954 RepID=A0ACB9R3M8_9MYRT|nr:hypothetical protein MLD38_010523 [Melastoma candidum]